MWTPGLMVFAACMVFGKSNPPVAQLIGVIGLILAVVALVVRFIEERARDTEHT